MKNFLIIAFMLFGLTGFSQDTFFQESSVRAKKEAIDITNQYIPELALSGEEQLLFQKKVEEFLIRRYRVEKDFKGREKLDRLLALQQEETAEMNDILTRAQLEVYKKIRPQIQPLETVELEED